MVERNVHAALDVLLLAFARRAHVDDDRLSRGEPFRRERRADALRGRRQIGPRLQASQPVRQIADDVIEADAAEPYRRFLLAARVGDDHDRPLAIEHGAGPRRILSAEADVDAASQMPLREVPGIAHVEHLRPGLLHAEHAL